MKFNDNFLKMDLYRFCFNSAGDNFHNIFVKLYIPVRIRTLFQKGARAVRRFILFPMDIKPVASDDAGVLYVQNRLITLNSYFKKISYFNLF